ncbi:protein SPEAR1-like isoform X2 [Ananas comosus]|uniref:Protein SPEAR1-like isoform X2 n=1 Tax=Ananas comosus TaxID=4615 RepID=A0A6P5EYR6_ANACO|nr:protein SPEAR1-like isoform X2 [Ananas comosus]
MGSSSFGDFGLNDNNSNRNNNNNGRSSSGSSRKGKKCGLEKPKQPQRGLGVAQLEKIRLQNQMMSTYFPSFQSSYQSDHTNKEDMRTHLAFQSCPTSSSLRPNNYMMGFGETTTNDIRFTGCHPSATARSLSAGDEMFLTYDFMRPIETLPLLAQPVEDSVQKRRRNDRCRSMGSVSNNSDSSDQSQELDLELRLSL